MKKILMAALPLLFLFCHDALCETIPASDGRITYIGRTRADNGAVSFDWTGVYLRVRFQGTSLSFKVSDTNKDYYNVWLDSSMDRTPDKVIAVHGSDTTIVIFSAEELRGVCGGSQAIEVHTLLPAYQRQGDTADIDHARVRGRLQLQILEEER